MNLKNKNLLLIICGGISAYKNLDLIRNLKKQGMNIKVILTENAKEFRNTFISSHLYLKIEFIIINFIK